MKGKRPFEGDGSLSPGMTPDSKRLKVGSSAQFERNGGLVVTTTAVAKDQLANRSGSGGQTDEAGALGASKRLSNSQFPVKRKYLPEPNKRQVKFLDEAPSIPKELKPVNTYTHVVYPKQKKGKIHGGDNLGQIYVSKDIIMGKSPHAPINVANLPESTRANLGIRRDDYGKGKCVEVEGGKIDMVPSFGQRNKKFMGCEMNDSTSGCKRHDYGPIGVEKFDSVTLNKPNESGAFKQSSTKGVADHRIGAKGEPEFERFAEDLIGSDAAMLNEDQENASCEKVKLALDLFKDTYSKLMREHKRNRGEENSGRQVHVEAANILKRQGKWVNTTEKFLGKHVPGVEVGAEFQFRVELSIVGLHGPLEAGIDYIKKDQEIIATSIVDSGRYAKQFESSSQQVTPSFDVLTYIGQGGNPLVSQFHDQKLERGNLALCNSMNSKTPVRVIYKHNERQSMYIYHGLYTVEECLKKRGKSGKWMFQFKMRRIPGQRPLFTREVVKPSRKYEAPKEKVVVNDVSQGKEKNPIRAINMDNEKPPSFNYVINMIYPEWFCSSMPQGCDCANGCSNPMKCFCAIKNGGRKSIVYECGPCCRCDLSTCTNRRSQWGLRYQLELFKKESGGWGVRTRSFISTEKCVCEYVGQLNCKEDGKNGVCSNYHFDIGSQNDKHCNYRFVIDASECGNIARFVNYSCSPNLYPRYILYDHDDKRMPHVMLFAAKDIPPLRELTLKSTKQEVCDCGACKFT